MTRDVPLASNDASDASDDAIGIAEAACSSAKTKVRHGKKEEQSNARMPKLKKKMMMMTLSRFTEVEYVSTCHPLLAGVPCQRMATCEMI